MDCSGEHYSVGHAIPMSCFTSRACRALAVARREMFMDPIILARVQFTANMTFHILFPTFLVAAVTTQSAF